MSPRHLVLVAAALADCVATPSSSQSPRDSTAELAAVGPWRVPLGPCSSPAAGVSFPIGL